jgi:hypothetical protein
MRIEITRVYPGEKWKKKVMRMTDNQVIAIYFGFLKNKKIER